MYEQTLIKDEVLEQPAPKPGARTLRVLDVFSGAGGFSLGFEQAGCRVAGAIEHDRWAAETFAANHHGAEVLQRDVSSVQDAELRNTFGLGAPTILLGGPPCQGFSVCVRDNGDPEDPRNLLFREFLRIAKLFEPEAVVLENVPNIVKARMPSGRFVTDIIRSELEEIGYHVYSAVLEAVDFGVPQIRKRFFLVACTKELQRPFPRPTHKWLDRSRSQPADLFDDGVIQCPTLWDAISDLPQLSAGEGSDPANYENAPQNQYQATLREDAETLRNHTAMRHSPRMVERFKAMGWGIPVSELPKHLHPRRRNSLEVANVVYDQNNRRLFPDRPCHTLPASFYANFVHPYCHRNFTPREGARIQSFPDTYVFKGKPTVCSHKLLAREGRIGELHLCQYSQIGNAVPPLLAKAVADNLISQI